MDRKRGNGFVIAVGLISVAVFYVLSFGPAMYLTTKLSKVSKTTAFFQVLNFLYRPHFTVMYHQEWYYDYACWCAKKASGQDYAPYQVYREWWRTDHG